ncbi:MAG TPA: alpha/beta fold hydrolase [Stellaceae bacterium]|nr:alpha/beta fold hydrolase [Stellaceae bacterium]
MTEVRRSTERIDGCAVSVQRAGSGEPLLFLHGARGGMHWLPFMDRLARRFEVIAPEHPGFGLSETPDWLETVGDLAYFYLDFMAALGLRQVNLVGTSLGGWIAAELAVRDESALKTLTLVAAAGIHVKGVPKGDLFLWSPEQLVRNLFVDQRLADAMLSRAVPEAEQDLMMKNALTTAKLAWQPRLYNPQLAKWLHRIKTPTLLLWGDGDKVIPPAYGPAFRDLIPHSRLRILRECGHVPHIEKTEDYVAAIADFIAEARP